MTVTQMLDAYMDRYIPNSQQKGIKLKEAPRASFQEFANVESTKQLVWGEGKLMKYFSSNTVIVRDKWSLLLIMLAYQTKRPDYQPPVITELAAVQMVTVTSVKRHCSRTNSAALLALHVLFLELDTDLNERFRRTMTASWSLT